MKIFIRHSVPLLATVLALATGCSKDLPNEPARLTGTLQGMVVLHDVWGKRLSDNSGVRVSVEGTNYQAMTQTNGTWTIANLPAGTYNLKLSKSGFNDHRFFGYGFVGGGNAYANDAYMVTTPANFEFTSFKGDISPVGVRFSGSISRMELEALPVTIFVGTTPDVSFMPGKYIHELTPSAFYTAPSGISDFPIVHLSYEHLYGLGVAPGSTLYARAYLTSPVNTGYYDPAARVNIRTNLSTISSSVLSFKLP